MCPTTHFNVVSFLEARALWFCWHSHTMIWSDAIHLHLKRVVSRDSLPTSVFCLRSLRLIAISNGNSLSLSFAIEALFERCKVTIHFQS